MQALTCRSSAAAAAARRCVPPQAKRPLPSLLGAVATPLAVAAPGTLLHASAPALGGGTPGEWNNVHQWKTRAKLAAMKEAADKAAKAAGAKKDGGEGAAKAMPGKEGTIAALPGEKVLVLDENLPDGALEEYFAGLRSARGGQGEGGAGTGAAGAAGAEGGAAGKPKRKTIKKHMLFGWNYKKSDKGAQAAAAAGGAGAGAGAGVGGKPQQPSKKAAATSSQ